MQMAPAWVEYGSMPDSNLVPNEFENCAMWEKLQGSVSIVVIPVLQMRQLL